eukprot:3429502-Pleurochrysis_carterae.AAC.1
MLFVEDCAMEWQLSKAKSLHQIASQSPDYRYKRGHAETHQYGPAFRTSERACSARVCARARDSSLASACTRTSDSV